MPRRLIALLGNLGSDSGYSLVKAGMELDGRRLGECIIVDATVSVLDLTARAEELGASDLVLVVPEYEGPPRLECSDRVEPEREPEKLPPDNIVRRLWQNLTGSLDPDDYVEALRIFWRRGFLLCKCRPLGDSCIEVLLEELKPLCQEPLSNASENR